MNNVQVLIDRLEKDAVKHHSIKSKWSQALINCVINNQDNEIVGDWLFIGDVDLEFKKLKGLPLPDNRVPELRWIKLNSKNIELKC